MNEGMKNEFSNFRQKIMEKVTKELIQSATIIFSFITITVLAPHFANHDQQSVRHLVFTSICVARIMVRSLMDYERALMHTRGK